MTTETTGAQWRAFTAHLKKEIPDVGKTVETSNVDEEEFPKFCSLVQSRSTLGLASALLKSLKTSNNNNTESSINPRVLLTAFMIQRFPKELLEEINLHEASEAVENENQLDKKCFEDACELVNYVLNSKENVSENEVNKMCSLLVKFDTTFTAWKEVDKQKMISVLCNKYTQYEQSIRFMRQNSTDKTPSELKSQLTASQSTTKTQIERIAGPGFFQQFVDGLNETLEQIDQQEEQIMQQNAPQQNRDETEEKTNENEPVKIDLSKIIMECASEKYWKDFETELKSGNFERVLLLITEISNRIKNLTPSRPTLHQRLDMKLDLDLIKQQIHFKALNGQDFLKIFETLWDSLAMLQAPEEDEKWQMWKEKQVKLFTADGASWAEILPQLFNEFLMKLDRIEDMTAQLRKHIADEQAKKEAKL